MKGIEIFCASQASTAICLSTDRPSSSSSSSANTINQFGGRAIDRHNPIISDPRRTPSRDLTTPSSPFHDLQKAKKNTTTSKPSDKKKKSATKGTHHHDQKKKSTVEKVTEHVTNNYSSKPIDSILKRSWVKPPSSDNLITPTTSSRYLLGETTTSLDGVSDYDPVFALTKVDNNKKAQVVVEDDKNNRSSKCSSSSSVPKSGSSDQVVVLRVSLHCKGCEGKVRKHLSRMQGVTSFNIDFAAKKVTVVGDVTPLSVLASISKVKTAQIWPASVSAAGSGMAETKKTNVI